MSNCRGLFSYWGLIHQPYHFAIHIIYAIGIWLIRLTLMINILVGA